MKAAGIIIAAIVCLVSGAGAASDAPSLRIIKNLGLTDRHHVISRVFRLTRTDYAALEFYVQGMIPGAPSAWGKLATIYRNGHFWNYVIINNRFVRRINDQVASERSSRVRLLLPAGVLRKGLNIITFTSERPYKGDFDDYDVADVRLLGRMPATAQVPTAGPRPDLMVKPRPVRPEPGTPPSPAPPSAPSAPRATRPPRGPATASSRLAAPFLGQWRYTVLRSPHIDKKSREQFEIRTHKRLIFITDPTAKTVDSISRLNLPAGVDIRVKA